MNYLFKHVSKGGCGHVIDAFINAISVFVSLNLAYASEVFQKQSCRPMDDGTASIFANSWASSSSFSGTPHSHLQRKALR